MYHATELDTSHCGSHVLFIQQSLWAVGFVPLKIRKAPPGAPGLSQCHADMQKEALEAVCDLLKGTVHSNIRILSSFIHPQVVTHKEHRQNKCFYPYNESQKQLWSPLTFTVWTLSFICVVSLLKWSQVSFGLKCSRPCDRSRASCITTQWLYLCLYSTFGVSLSRHRPGSSFMSMTVSLGWTSHLAEWQHTAMTLDTNLASHFYSISSRKCFFLSLFWDHIHVLSLVQISSGSFSAPVSETSARLKTGDICLCINSIL